MNSADQLLSLKRFQNKLFFNTVKESSAHFYSFCISNEIDHTSDSTYTITHGYKHINLISTMMLLKLTQININLTFLIFKGFS